MYVCICYEFHTELFEIMVGGMWDSLFFVKEIDNIKIIFILINQEN